jgi:preprotein translocase subunit YajC
MNLASVFLMLGQGQGGGGFQFIFLGLMILVFWMFMIRPQAKKAKQQKNFLANLQKGDKVVTIAGIHGTINRMNDDGTFQLEINPGSYIKMEKTAISMEMSAKLNAVQTAAPIK